MLTLAHLQQAPQPALALWINAVAPGYATDQPVRGRSMDPAWEWLSAKGQLFIWQIRLPRTLAVVLVGAALALSGAIMQALFENPLAEPGLLGVSNGAGVGLIAAVLLGKGVLPGWALGLCAILARC